MKYYNKGKLNCIKIKVKIYYNINKENAKQQSICIKVIKLSIKPHEVKRMLTH